MAGISLEVKKKCVEMRKQGISPKRIYDTYFSAEHPSMSYECFRHKIKRWERQIYADSKTLNAGTYEGFIAHGATVQVDRNGDVVQAWIKQTEDERQWERLLETISENTAPIILDDRGTDLWEPSKEMLEIPLFDQHFPISDHSETLFEILNIVKKQLWDEINVIIGQDMLHNDDMRGRTSSGRPIERVDMVKAWNMAKTFYATLIQACLKHAEKVNIIYSKGNHDESMSWAFVQMLKAMFPQANVDDSLKQRKCISWENCFIGLTHGAYKKSSMTDLCGQFTIQFATEFAAAKVREIHAGHLHREEDKDIYGVMCRRLSRNGNEDEWSDDEGLVGANKRFMVFRWKPGRLAGIEYV